MIKNFNDKRNYLSCTFLFLVCIFLSLMLIIFCTSESPTVANSGGSGTGVGNGTIMGKVVYSNAQPVKDAIVRLRTEGYLADTSGKISQMRNDTSATVTTNKDGVFIINSVKKGRHYYIEVLNNYLSTQDFGTIYKITFTGGNRNDTIVLPTRVVGPVKKIQGSIILSGLPQNAYIQIYGIERIGRSDSTGKFEITDLPVGQCKDDECRYKLRVMVLQSNNQVKIYDYKLEIETDKNKNVVEVELDEVKLELKK